MSDRADDTKADDIMECVVCGFESTNENEFEFSFDGGWACLDHSEPFMTIREQLGTAYSLIVVGRMSGRSEPLNRGIDRFAEALRRMDGET